MCNETRLFAYSALFFIAATNLFVSPQGLRFIVASLVNSFPFDYKFTLAVFFTEINSFLSADYDAFVASMGLVRLHYSRLFLKNNLKHIR